MDKRPDIVKKAEKALESLDGIKKAEPQPFFYTRLIGLLQRDEKTWWETAGSFLARPVTVAICLGFILFFNAVILFRQDTDNDISLAGSQTEIATENEYVLASNSSFDYENLDQQ
ncbi:MAG: hypothetical protein ACHQFX_12875 [Chitinophagales bacterium]